MKSRRDEYLEKLRDPRWQQMRLRVFERDEFTCQSCYDTSKTLHVHHAYYLDGAEPWEYPLDALVTLCEDCHELETDLGKEERAKLLRAISKHFLAWDMCRITRGFEAYQRPHVREVTASFLEWFLTERPLEQELLAMFWEHTSKAATQNRRNDESGTDTHDQT